MKIKKMELKGSVLGALFCGNIGYFAAWALGMYLHAGLSAPESLTLAGNFLRGAAVAGLPTWLDPLILVSTLIAGTLGYKLIPDRPRVVAAATAKEIKKVF